MAHTDLTPYFASKIASAKLNKEFKSQQFYGYAKSGKIASNYKEYKSGSADKILFDGESFAAWLASPHTAKSTAKLDELLAEYI